MDVCIRRMKACEIDSALDLAWEVFQAFEAADYGAQGTAAFYQSIHDPHWRATLRIYGAFAQVQLVGVLAARNHGGHIALFFVKGAYHRQGIGRRLFAHLLQDSPASAISVNAAPYAVPVYRRLGFAQTDAEQVRDGIRYTPMLFLRCAKAPGPHAR